MGQKVNPIGLRVGINRTWDSRWYADEDYAGLLHEDLKLRKYLEGRLVQAGVSKIVIERPAKKARVTIHSASTTIDREIFDSPCSRSRNVIGASPTSKPARSERITSSIWNTYPAPAKGVRSSSSRSSRR